MTKDRGIGIYSMKIQAKNGLEAQYLYIYIFVFDQGIVFSSTHGNLYELHTFKAVLNNLNCFNICVLKRISFGSKDCTKELKLECAYFLGQTS